MRATVLQDTARLLSVQHRSPSTPKWRVESVADDRSNLHDYCFPNVRPPRAQAGAPLMRKDPVYRLTWRLAPPLGPLSGPLPRTSPVETSLTHSEPLPL